MRYLNFFLILFLESFGLLICGLYNKISHFSTIILNKNTHKIIILGIYIFDHFLNIAKMPKKAVFSEVGVHTPYPICKKNEKIRSGYTFKQNEKIRFFCVNIILFF